MDRPKNIDKLAAVYETPQWLNEMAVTIGSVNVEYSDGEKTTSGTIGQLFKVIPVPGNENYLSYVKISMLNGEKITNPLARTAIMVALSDSYEVHDVDKRMHVYKAHGPEATDH